MPNNDCQHRLDYSQHDFWSQLESVLALREEDAKDVNDIVTKIISDIRQNGDDALLKYTAQFDHHDITIDNMRVTDNDINDAMAQCTKAQIDALQLAYQRINDYHQKLLPSNLDYRDHIDVRLGARWNAVDAAGLYVPGGIAAYPSSVLMNAVAAKTAGVKRLVMNVPFSGGQCSPLVLAAAHISNIDEIYKIGGAQAIAAMAYGTKTIAPVDKIVGPGNIYVATAKRMVFGKVGIDMVAGPSEILVIADENNNPSHSAMDLLSQCEHDANAQAVLITNNADFADKVNQHVKQHLQTLSRRDIAGQSWRDFGVIITVDDWQQAVAITNRIAPEHLQISLDDDMANNMMAKIRHAGSIFLGRNSPEAFGDYIAGPNHVLPTLANARFSSGLSPLDFMKRTSFINIPESALEHLGEPTITLAMSEELEAHALSVKQRLKS